MIDKSKQIEMYLGREVDFLSEVNLQDDSDGNGVYIKEWNLTEKTKPDLTKLTTTDADHETLFGVKKTTEERIKDLENYKMDKPK